MQLSHDGEAEGFRRGWWQPPFAVLLAMVVLVLSFLYAVTFTRMVYLSLVEQVLPHEHVLPRFAGPPHSHNAVEWVLLVVPALAGWLGMAGSLVFLGRRSRKR